MIGILNEKPLHAALEEWYTRPQDRIEVEVDGFLIDIVRGKTLVEIQTRGFGAIRRKLDRLTGRHRVRLVYPLAAEKWIVRQTRNGRVLGRRRSPRQGSIWDLFEDLVGIPSLVAKSRFMLEVLFTREDEVRRRHPRRRWPNDGWRTVERWLLGVAGSKTFRRPADFLEFVPEEVREPFTTRDLADVTVRPLWLTQ